MSDEKFDNSLPENYTFFPTFNAVPIGGINCQISSVWDKN